MLIAHRLVKSKAGFVTVIGGMAVAKQAAENEASGQEEAVPRKRGGLFTVLKAVGFVAIIVVLEIAATAMLAPSAQETEKLAEQLAAASTGEEVHATGDEHEDAHGTHEAHHEHYAHDELQEVELGSFNVTRFNPETNTTLAIDFELYGTVLKDEETEFMHVFEHSKARVREQITMALHAAESVDLQDAGLGLIKRRILEKTNRALGQPLLKEVLFSKFSFVER
jgi:flagellar FliL protein